MNHLSSIAPLPVLFRILIGASIFLLALTQTVFAESLILQSDDVPAGFQTASADATLSSLTLTGVSFSEPFSPEKTVYIAETSASEVLVSAVVAHDGATVVITPSDTNSEGDGHRVALEEGETDIGISVTAEDGRTTETYTITVTRSIAVTDETVPLIESEPESDVQTGIGPIDKIIATPGDTEVTVTWATSSTTDVTGWQFAYRTQATSSETWADVPSSTASTTSHTITSLTNGTAYLFKIRAKGSSSTTGTAAEAVATPNTGITATDFDSNDNNLIDITTLEQLNAIRYDLDGDGIPSGAVANQNAYYDAFKTSQAGFFCTECAGYELMNDLDFDTDDDGRTWTGTVNSPTGDSGDTYNNSGSGWEPISTSSAQFTSTFDGNGFVISNLYISRGSTSNVGLFGVNNSSGVITAVALKDALVIGGISTGSLVGRNDGTVSISYATGSVTGGNNTGGLVGFNNGGVVTSSYSAASATAAAGLRVGGLVGNQSGSTAMLKNSYSIGLVSGSGTAVGGLLGRKSAGAVLTSYWNTTTSGQTGSPGGGVGKTTAELQTPTDYTGIYSTWDDDDIDGIDGADAPWDFGAGSQYPLLAFGGHRVETQAVFVDSIIASSGDGQATVTWVPLTTEDVTGWEFTYKTQAATSWETWAAVPGSTANTTSHTIPSLTNDTVYLIKVRAVGEPESVAAFATPGASVSALDFDSNDNNRIEITTLEQLNAMRYDLDGDGLPSGTEANIIAYYDAFKTSQAGFFCDACAGYELMNSLDFNTGDAAVRTDDTYNNSGSGWEPIGDADYEFATNFDGNGFVIRNLLINRGSILTNSGLFGRTGSTAVLTEIALRDASVTAGESTGLLVGYNTGTVRVSYVTGSVTGTTAVGGFVGNNRGGTIEASYSHATVSGTTSVGGFAGIHSHNARIINSYSAGAVSGTGSTIGGFIGSTARSATVSNSYWDTETSGQSASPGGGAARNTGQLKAADDYYSANLFRAWDDNDLDGDGQPDAPWGISAVDGDHYPYLIFAGHHRGTQHLGVSHIIAIPGDTQVTVSWATESVIATGWEFAYKTQAAESWETWAAVPDSTVSTTSHTITSLTNGTDYLFKVRAVDGPESGEVIATPNTGIPVTDFDTNDNGLIDITTLAQLDAMRYDLDGDGSPGDTVADVTAYRVAFPTSRTGFFCDTPCTGYELLNSLDFDTDDDGSTWTEIAGVITGDSDDTYYNGGSGWNPIANGTSVEFVATFDGNGLAIENLFINRPSGTNYIGLFCCTSKTAVLTDIVLKNVKVIGDEYTGSIVGYHDGVIRASQSAGTVTGESNIGGFVGVNRGVIEASHSAVDVSGESRVGGLVGINFFNVVRVRNSYATGVVSATTSTPTNIGGLIGANLGSARPEYVENSYWDTDTSGQTSSPGGTGKTTAELQSPTGYTGIYSAWDDRDIDGDGENDAPWDFGTDSEYPTLVLEGPTSLFSLDLDGGGTFVARQDLLGTYLFLAEGISDSQLRTYTHDQEQSTANEMVKAINKNIAGAAPPLDFDGNSTVSARLDVLGAYLYTAEGISASQLRAYTHDQEQSTANGMARTIDSLIE